MNHPVLSIDVAKGKSVAAAFISSNQLFRKPFSFEHSPSGLQSLLPLLAEMESLSNAKPHVVLEATGNYSRPLSSFFSSCGFPVVVLNPILTHQLKKKAIRKVKTDSIDAARIAQAYYLGNGSPELPLEDSFLELRTLTRQHHHLNSLYTDVQLHVQAVLDLIFPGNDQLFSQTCCGTSLRILAAFPTPGAVLAADPEELLALMLPNRRGRA
ncbi:IS110 family transposase [Gorillibacterium massiliense]|uniref:IS110 family transposase n=1 Tax=Gorillibacterium massiliense TaxID=1280390 RepID=UPI0004B442A8|nr:IS110 family transposase [Gorillibacterium massiliense]